MNRFESKNRFEVLSQDKDQVFQQGQSAIELTLAGIMRELADIKTWQFKHQNLNQTGSNQADWRQSQDRNSQETEKFGHPKRNKKVVPNSKSKYKSTASSGLTQSTFINDGIKAWNKASVILKNCQTIGAAKQI